MAAVPSWADAEVVAVAIRKTFVGEFRCWASREHAGIDYNEHDGTVRTLHIDFRGAVSENWFQPVVAAIVPPALEDLTLRACVEVARKFAERYRGRSIPYSLPGATTRISMDGTLETNASHGGLTCSMFVLEVVRAVTNEPVIDVHAWKVDEDSLSRWVNSPSHDADTRDRLKQAVVAGAIRVTPLEMLAACACSEWPVGDASLCRTKANEIADRLDDASI